MEYRPQYVYYDVNPPKVPEKQEDESNIILVNKLSNLLLILKINIIKTKLLQKKN